LLTRKSYVIMFLYMNFTIYDKSMMSCFMHVSAYIIQQWMKSVWFNHVSWKPSMFLLGDLCTSFYGCNFYCYVSFQIEVIERENCNLRSCCRHLFVNFWLGFVEFLFVIVWITQPVFLTFLVVGHTYVL